MPFYYSKKPLTKKQRETVSLIGFDLDWYINRWLAQYGVTMIGDDLSISIEHAIHKDME